MTVEADLRTLLLSFGSAITDKVGTGNAARIRPDRLHEEDDDTQAAIIVEVDNERPLNTLDGKGGRRYADVTLRCRARTKAAARALAESVRTKDTDPGTGLAGYNGTVSGTEYDAVLDDEQTSFSPAADGSDQGWYDVFSNYVVTWAETI